MRLARHEDGIYEVDIYFLKRCSVIG